MHTQIGRMAPAIASWRDKMKTLLQEDLNDLRGSHEITHSDDSEVLFVCLRGSTIGRSDIAVTVWEASSAAHDAMSTRCRVRLACCIKLTTDYFVGVHVG